MLEVRMACMVCVRKRVGGISGYSACCGAAWSATIEGI